MSRSTDAESHLCGFPLERIITQVNINPSGCQFEPYHDWGLGKTITSKKQKSEELSRIKGETGREFVEVGNDKQKGVKPQRQEYTYDKSIRLHGGV